MVWRNGVRLAHRNFKGGYYQSGRDENYVWHNGQQTKVIPLRGVRQGNFSIDDVNENGVGVGWAETNFKPARRFAFVVIKGQMISLNSLLPSGNWRLVHARAINNRGQIAGDGFLNNRRQFFLLTPQTPATSSTRTDE